MLLTTHSSLLIGGESVSVALWGFAASFTRQSSSRAATPEESLHKSRTDSVVRIWGQLKRCCVVCSWMQQRGQSGDGCVEVLILCRHDRRKGYLFVHIWARVRRVCRGKFSSVLSTSCGCVLNICYSLLQRGAKRQYLYVCRACLLLCLL